jgi:hypothetical protein
MKVWLWAILLATALQARGEERLADVEIVDRASGKTIPVVQHDGRCYLAGRPGKEYSIRIRNRFSEDLLAVVSVDGINVVTGETGAVGQSGYILAPGSSFDINGWRKSLQRVAAFYFSRIDDSYASRTGRAENVGVIGVALFKRKAPPHDLQSEARSKKEAPAPASERSDSAASGLGTGHGRIETSVVRYAEFERASEQPNQLIALYYDSRENLVARGILPAPRRDPQPFPAGFVPDPPRS